MINSIKNVFINNLFISADLKFPGTGQIASPTTTALATVALTTKAPTTIKSTTLVAPPSATVPTGLYQLSSSLSSQTKSQVNIVIKVRVVRP
jgi:hypothetical protein